MVTPDWEATRLQLIDTYKTLNHRVRGRSEDELAADHNGDSIKAEIAAMRRHELQFAKALTTALIGDTSGMTQDQGEEAIGVTGIESDDDPTTLLISQFGSARATTLNTMASVDAEVWERPLIENRRMLDLAKDLVESDRAHMEKITRMLGA
jgi:hypothetical protein